MLREIDIDVKMRKRKELDRLPILLDWKALEDPTRRKRFPRVEPESHA